MADTHTDRPVSTTTLLHNPQTKTLSLSPQPIPYPSANSQDEHLIRVHAVALTNGELAWPEPLEAKPFPIPGYEISGVVLESPANSTYRKGDEVIARTSFDRPGNARAYGVVLTHELGRKPSNISWEAAAALPLSALTAWQALFDHGGLPPLHVIRQNDSATPEPVHDGAKQPKVLITAAAGGVGIYAVQLAKQAGAYVVGTASASNLTFVTDFLGADEALDYHSTTTVPQQAEYDLVLDCVGGKFLAESWTKVKPGGTLISIVQPPETMKPKDGVEDGVRALFFIVEAKPEQLDQLTLLVEKEKLKVLYDSAYELDDYEAALKRLSGGHLRGKVVLTIPEA